MRYLIRLFYVEHSKFNLKRMLLVIFTSLSVISCKKKLDPNPELRDPVILTLNNELTAAKADLTAKENDIKTIQTDKKNAAPQSGENKVFERRLNDAQEARALAEQRVRYFEIKIEQQKLIARKLYLESQLPDGKPWPSPESTKAGLEDIENLRERARRMAEKNVPRGTKDAKSQAGHAAPAAAGGHGEPAPAPAGH